MARVAPGFKTFPDIVTLPLPTGVVFADEQVPAAPHWFEVGLRPIPDRRQLPDRRRNRYGGRRADDLQELS
jgi:hypothetical protein